MALFNTLKQILTPYANKINLHTEEIEEIQGDVSEVKADLNPFHPPMEIGAIAHGNDSANSAAARIKGYVLAPEGTKIYATKYNNINFNSTVFFYDSDYAYIANSEVTLNPVSTPSVFSPDGAMFMRLFTWVVPGLESEITDSVLKDLSKCYGIYESPGTQYNNSIILQKEKRIIDSLCSLIIGNGKYIDYTNGTITIPNDTLVVLQNKGTWSSHSLSQTTISNVTTSTYGSGALKLFVDTSDWTIKIKKYNEDPTAGLVFIGALRISAGYPISFVGDFPWSVNGVPYNINEFSTILKHKNIYLLLGNDEYVEFSNTAKTITIPADTIIVTPTSYKILSSNTVVDWSGVNSSAIKLYVNISTGEFSVFAYNNSTEETSTLQCIAVFRTNTTGWGHDSVSANFPWSVDGKPYSIDFDSIQYRMPEATGCAVKSIAHRGYSLGAPENTLPAYKLAKAKGFSVVETDIAFTHDGVAVLLHDETINRTARNLDGTEIEETLYIDDIDYDNLENYDFGIWKSSAYAGTSIPTFEKFIELCRNLGLHPYIELKNDYGSNAQTRIEGLVDTVRDYGMAGKVTWISFSDIYLGYVKNHDVKARLGYVRSTLDATAISVALSLKTENNEVFIDSNDRSASTVALCKNAGLALETWTIDFENGILSLDPYITGVTSNALIAAKVLYEAYK